MSGCALSPDSLIRTFPCHTGVERPALSDLLMMTLLDLRTGVDTDLLMCFTSGLPTESAFCWRCVRISRLPPLDGLQEVQGHPARVLAVAKVDHCAVLAVPAHDLAHDALVAPTADALSGLDGVHISSAGQEIKGRGSAVAGAADTRAAAGRRGALAGGGAG